MVEVGLYALLLAHFNAYKEGYANIGLLFAITYLLKKIIKSSGANDQGDLIGLGGYALTFGEFFRLLGDIQQGGFLGLAEVSNKFIGGTLSGIFNLIKKVSGNQ